VWVVVHCNHARELSQDVDVALARLVDAGIPVLNQAVLLRGVNDDADALRELCESLVRRRVFPYYLHHTDAATGNAHFRVPIEEGRALHAELAKRVSGIALPRYVVDPPDGSGKVDVG
jgi:lysine 2,3-aminomutase